MIHTLSSPSENTLIINMEPKIRIPHIVIKEKTKGAFVSPIPLNVPSKIIKIPYIGSLTETIRKTLVPKAITRGSGVNKAIK